MAFNVKVGTFTKTTSAPGPQSQAVTGVGFQPTVLMLWVTGALTSGTFRASSRLGYGFSTGSSKSYSQSQASEDNIDSGTGAITSAWITKKVLSIADFDFGTAVIAEC